MKERGRRKEGEEKSQRQHKTIAEFDERRASATNKKRIYDKAGQKDCNECDVSGVVGKGSKPRISIGKGCAGEGAGEGVASSSPLGSAAMRLGFAGFFSAFGSTADASNNENGDSSTDEDNRATEGEPMTEAAEEMSREAGIKDSLQIRSIGESEGAEDATANLECASCGGCSRCDSLKGRNECDVHGDTATKQNVPLILGRQAGTADGANGVVSPPLLGSARFSSFGGFFASFGATADASKNTDNVSQETGDRKPAQEQPATEVTEEAGVGVRTKQVTADKMWTLAAGEVEGEASPPGSATRLSLSDFFTGFGASADVNNNDSGSIAEDETLMEDSPPTEIAEKAVTAAGKSELLREKTSPLGSARMLSFGGFFSGFGGISADTSNDADTGSTEDQLTQEQPAAAIVIEEAGGSGAAREESLLDQATPKLDDSSGREPCNGRSEPGVNAVGEEEKTRASFRVQAGEGGSDNVVNPLGSARRSLGGFFSSFGASVDASNNANSSSAVAPRTADVCSSGASRPQLYGGAVEGKENISFAGSAGAGAKDARDYEGTSEVEKAGNDYTSARNREDRDSGASCPESIGDKNDPGNGPRWKGLATLFSIKAGVAFNVEESRKRRATVKKQ